MKRVLLICFLLAICSCVYASGLTGGGGGISNIVNNITVNGGANEVTNTDGSLKFPAYTSGNLTGQNGSVSSTLTNPAGYIITNTTLVGTVTLQPTIVWHSNGVWQSFATMSNYTQTAMQDYDKVFMPGGIQPWGPASNYASGTVFFSNDMEVVGLGQLNTTWDLNDPSGAPVINQGVRNEWHFFTVNATNSLVNGFVIQVGLNGTMEDMNVLVDTTNAAVRVALNAICTDAVNGNAYFNRMYIYSPSFAFSYCDDDNFYLHQVSVVGTGDAPVAVISTSPRRNVFLDDCSIVSVGTNAAQTNAAFKVMGTSAGTSNEIVNSTISVTNTAGGFSAYFFDTSSKTFKARWKIANNNFVPPLTTSKIFGTNTTYVYTAGNVTVTNLQGASGQVLVGDGAGNGFWGIDPNALTNATLDIGTVTAANGILTLHNSTNGYPFLTSVAGSNAPAGTLALGGNGLLNYGTQSSGGVLVGTGSWNFAQQSVPNTANAANQLPGQLLVVTNYFVNNQTQIGIKDAPGGTSNNAMSFYFNSASTNSMAFVDLSAQGGQKINGILVGTVVGSGSLNSANVLVPPLSWVIEGYDGGSNHYDLGVTYPNTNIVSAATLYTNRVNGLVTVQAVSFDTTSQYSQLILSNNMAGLATYGPVVPLLSAVIKPTNSATLFGHAGDIFTVTEGGGGTLTILGFTTQPIP